MGLLDIVFRREGRNGGRAHRRTRRGSTRPVLERAMRSQGFEFRASFEQLESKALLAVDVGAGSLFPEFEMVGPMPDWQLSSSSLDDQEVVVVSQAASGSDDEGSVGLLTGLDSFEITATSAAAYVVDFEDANKTSFASGTVTLSGINWDLTDALIGTLALDWKDGAKSARLRGVDTSAMTMLADKTLGAGTISFQYRRYGTDTQVAWQVQSSTTSGTSWVDVGVPFTAPASDEVQTFSATLDTPGNIRFRIIRDGVGNPSTNRRLNIDNITITDFAPAGLPLISPVASLTPFATPAGRPSLAQSFTVTGSDLTADITATAPTGFELSLDGTTYGPTVTLPEAGGAAAGTVFVRIAASNTTPGPLSGSIVLTSGSAASAFVALTGTVRIGSIELPYFEDFEASQGDWFTFDAGGSRNWQYLTSSFGGGSTGGGPTTRVWEMNGFGSTGGAANDWLLLGPVNLSGATNPAISFSTLTRFTAPPELFLKVSTDYPDSGDPDAATWTTIDFPRATGQLTRTPTGLVSLADYAGESSVYVAFHYIAGGTDNGETALWQIDDVAIRDVAGLTFGLPAAMPEGTGGDTPNAVVSIPAAQAGPVTLTITSTDPTEILLDDGLLPFRESIVVTIPAGQASASFFVQAQRDRVNDGNQTVRITASVNEGSIGFGEFPDAEGFIEVIDVDVAPAALTEDGYTQDFATFAAATPELPLGWAAVGPVTTFQSDPAQQVWSEGFSSGFRGGASVFGYQHTGTTGVLVKSLTLENATAETINALTVSYLGRVARETEGRDPFYTVAIESAAGTQTVAALGYSTADGDNARRQTSLFNLNLAPGEAFTITWTSDTNAPGSGGRKQIGISDVAVAIGAQTSAPAVSGLTIDPAQIARTSAEVAAAVTDAGGLDLTGSGFVYIATASLSGELTLETEGAIDVPQLFAFEGEFVASLDELDPGTAYTIRAYATNAAGTAYTAPQTFRTVNPPASLTGVYEQPFDDFTGSLPVGWSVVATGNLLAYGGAWGSGSAAGYRGGVSNPGVLGYQHTSASGILTVTLSLINDTGFTISGLDIGYLGRVERADQGRAPAWEVFINDAFSPVGDLGYSTADPELEVAPDDAPVAATVSGLSIAPGGEITIQWVSTSGDGSGASRQIGIGEVAVTAIVVATDLPEVALGDPAAALVTPSSARLRGSVTATNGSVTSHGVVYALTADNPDPELGGANVSFIELPAGGLAAFDFFADVSDLVAGSEYSFKAYATNSFGTAYSPVGTLTTTTEAAAPTVTSPTVTGVVGSTATLGGTVESNGGATITEYGVVIAVESENAAPAIGDEGVIVVSVEEAIAGAFALPVTGLAGNTAYAFRAFATNSAGTSYSSVGLFATPELPTTLAVGDLSIIGFNANAPDGFAFVTWVDLAPNTQIKFTDNAFLSANAANDPDNARGGENFVTWTNSTETTIAAGTVITIVEVSGASPAAAAASLGSTAQVLNGLAAPGDQIFAYQGPGAGTSPTTSDFGTNSNPTTFSGSLVFGLTYGADWLAEPGATVNTNRSFLPSDLAGPSASIAITTGSTTSGQYTGTRSGFASLAEAQAAVTDPANWTTAIGTGVITLDATPFFLGELVGTTTSLESITPLTIDFGQTVTFAGTVAAASGSDSPTGTVQIRDGGSTGTLLATATVTGGSFAVESAEVPVGVYADIQAFYLPTGGFSASSSAVFGDTLTVVSTAVATSITLDSITPLVSTVGTTITFSGGIAAGEGGETPAGTIQIRSGGATGPVVASTTAIVGSGGIGSYSIEVSNLPVGVFGTLQAFFVANASFDASESEVFIDPVIVRPASVSPQFVRWTFEGDSLTPLIGAGTVSAIGEVTQTFAAGNRFGRALSTTAYPAQSTGSGTAGVEFLVSTAGRDSITLSFDHRPSNTASRWAQVDYTLDGGETWVTGHWNNGGTLPAEVFTTFDVDFSGVAGANDNPLFGVRIVSIFEPGTSAYQAAGTLSNYSTAGTWRFDNVAVGGFAGPTITTSTGAESLRVVTYNIAAAEGTGAPRDGLDTVLAAIGTEVVAGWSGPIDLLALQEVQSQAATTQRVVDSLNGIYGSGAYAAGSVNAFSSGGGTVGMVYNTNSLTLLEEVSILTGSGSPRNAMRYLFQPVAGTEAEIFYVYVSHFKAGTSGGDQATRAQEAAALRADADRLGAGTSILYVGDFNVYTSSETAYQTLLGSGGAQGIDPIDRPGSWSKNANFRDVFTQAPLVTGVDGLVGGGLNDRFDFQLVTDAVLSGTGLNYISGSYRAFGNNGSVNVNGAINSGSNTALAGMPNRLDVLDALTTASDHLPVVADYSVPTAAALSALSTTQGTASEPGSFTVRARSLSGNLTVTAPDGFEISTSAGGGYSADPLTLASTLGTVNATVFIRLAAETAAGTYGGDISISGGGAATQTLAMPTSTVEADPDPVAPVTVTGVYVRGSNWNVNYLARTPFTTLGGSALGWQLPDGPAQLTGAATVSWSNVNVISVRFDQAISQPAADALQILRGTTTGNQTILPTAAPTLLAGGTVAQWTLPAALASGRYVISIAAPGITNAAGTTTLDGDWTTSTSTFATGSGDGVAGGTFNFFFNVLVGNVNGDTTTNAGDISAIRTKLSSPLSTPLASDADYRLDVDGSNALNAADLSATRLVLSTALGTSLSSLPAVSAPVEISGNSFAALADGSEGTLSGSLSAEAWAWFALTEEQEASKKQDQQS